MFSSCYRYQGHRPPPPPSYGVLPLMFVGGAFLNVVRRRFQETQPAPFLPNSPQQTFSPHPPPKTPKLDYLFKCCRLPPGPLVGPPFN